MTLAGKMKEALKRASLPTFALFVCVGALQLQLLQSSRQVVSLLGGQILHVEAVVVEQQSQTLQRALCKNNNTDYSL